MLTSPTNTQVVQEGAGTRRRNRDWKEVTNYRSFLPEAESAKEVFLLWI